MDRRRELTSALQSPNDAHTHTTPAALVSRGSPSEMAMAAGLLGLQDDSSLAGAFALALVMHTLTPWRPPTGRALERARATARRYKLSEELAVFLPPEPGRFASRQRKDAYRGVIISLKHLDELQGPERERSIADVWRLLGVQPGA